MLSLINPEKSQHNPIRTYQEENIIAEGTTNVSLLGFAGHSGSI